ncbi:MAG: YitT family protein, partial [Pseudomonadota bacterium]
MNKEPHKRLEHSPLEDVQAFFLGTALCALAVQFLTHLGLITGQTAGLGVLLSYTSGWSFGVVFFLINLPFYIFAWLRMGPRFTIKSFVAVAMVSAMTESFAILLVFETLNPLIGALLAGATSGMGLIVLFRHGASLGGIGVLGLWLQDRIGVQAGWVQLGFDVVLFAFAVFMLEDIRLVALSLLGAVVVNLIIGVNHRN